VSRYLTFGQVLSLLESSLDMAVTVLYCTVLYCTVLYCTVLGAVGHLWYSLSLLSVLSNVLQLTIRCGYLIFSVFPIGWVVWVHLVVRTGTKLGGYPLYTGTVACSNMRSWPPSLCSCIHCVWKILWLFWSGVCYVVTGWISPWTPRGVHRGDTENIR
jgi:hypothetical protein